MTTNQELRKLAEEALRTQTQYTMQPNIARMNAAKAAKDALLDRIDRLEAENEAQRKLLEQAKQAMHTCEVGVHGDPYTFDTDQVDAAVAAITDHLKGENHG